MTNYYQPETADTDIRIIDNGPTQGFNAQTAMKDISRTTVISSTTSFPTQAGWGRSHAQGGLQSPRWACIRVQWVPNDHWLVYNNRAPNRCALQHADAPRRTSKVTASSRRIRSRRQADAERRCDARMPAVQAAGTFSAARDPLERTCSAPGAALADGGVCDVFGNRTHTAKASASRYAGQDRPEHGPADPSVPAHQRHAASGPTATPIASHSRTSSARSLAAGTGACADADGPDWPYGRVHRRSRNAS